MFSSTELETSPNLFNADVELYLDLYNPDLEMNLDLFNVDLKTNLDLCNPDLEMNPDLFNPDLEITMLYMLRLLEGSWFYKVVVKIFPWRVWIPSWDAYFQGCTWS